VGLVVAIGGNPGGEGDITKLRGISRERTT